jgi:hypothetical protein
MSAFDEERLPSVRRRTGRRFPFSTARDAGRRSSAVERAFAEQ